MGLGRVTSQYVVREASAPKPMRDDEEKEREDIEKDNGREGTRLFRLSTSDFTSPLKRRERSHSCNCIAERDREKIMLVFVFCKAALPQCTL